jgi:uncharacterized membrane protein YkoI
MNIKIISGLLALGLLAGGAAIMLPARAGDSQAALETRAKITKDAAQAAALARVPNGTVKESELEEEHGKLIWSFDIAIPGSKDISEVAVDAITGKVLSVESETPAQQAKEKLEDAKAAKKKAKAEEKDEAVTMAQVPDAAKKAAQAYASESEIKKIEKSESEGKVAYEFEIEKAGKKSEVKFTSKGRLIATEEETPLADVPEAARNAINDRATGGRVISAEKAVEKRRTVYEAVIEKDGKKIEITVSSKGRLIDTEEVKD